MNGVLILPKDNRGRFINRGYNIIQNSTLAANNINCHGHAGNNFS